MPLFRPSTDVRPITDFRANASAVIEQVQETRRPVILTQHGHSAAVLLDVEVYERMLDEIDFLRAVNIGQAQMRAGETIPHEDIEAHIRKRLAE